MTIPRIMMAAVLLALLGTGCKVRRISDGKPPRDGVTVSERIDPRFGPMRTEQHYREGKQVYSKGIYGNGVLAFERFNGIAGGMMDSAAWFFPSGTLFHTLVTTDDRIIRLKEYFEDGALRIDSDTTVNNEYYQSGKRFIVIRYENGSVVSIGKWYENGKHAEVSEWRNDLRHGRYQTWDSIGRPLIDERYVNGTMKERKLAKQH